MAEQWQRSPEPTDEGLVALVDEGDLDAFSLLYDRYARLIYVMAAHMLSTAEAEDVVQEVFLRLWRNVGQYDERRGPFAPWFLAIARHEIRARLRRRTREQRLARADDINRLLAEAADPGIDVEEQVLRRERGEHILRALDSLPPEQRRALVLAYFGELSQSTIAETLGWPLGTVKKRIRLGMQKLRRLLMPRESAEASAENGRAAPAGSVPLVRSAEQPRVDDGP